MVFFPLQVPPFGAVDGHWRPLRRTGNSSFWNFHRQIVLLLAGLLCFDLSSAAFMVTHLPYLF